MQQSTDAGAQARGANPRAPEAATVIRAFLATLSRLGATAPRTGAVRGGRR